MEKSEEPKKKEEKTKKDNFAEAVTSFYQKFLGATSESIDKLADIEEEFKDEYAKLKEIQKDPSLILDKLKELSDEEKNNLIILFARVAKFETKLIKLFDLSVDEKRELAEELSEFSKSLGV